MTTMNAMLSCRRSIGSFLPTATRGRRVPVSLEESCAAYPCNHRQQRHSSYSSTTPKRNTSSNNGDAERKVIRPYSGSLPSPGYDWCTRCYIPDRKLQKRIGDHNPCLDTPRLFGFGLCRPAYNYYKRQLSTLIAILGICFAVGSMSSTTTSLEQQQQERQQQQRKEELQYSWSDMGQKSPPSIITTETWQTAEARISYWKFLIIVDEFFRPTWPKSNSLRFLFLFLLECTNET